jgi:hypothetical protein
LFWKEVYIKEESLVTYRNRVVYHSSKHFMYAAERERMRERRKREAKINTGGRLIRPREGGNKLADASHRTSQGKSSPSTVESSRSYVEGIAYQIEADRVMG